jgi:prepilin-type N-terminal cleavage/methylation domain-containing protein
MSNANLQITNRKNYQSNFILSGYTLIELLVTLTIVGLLFGFGFVNFRDFSRRQSLQGAAEKIRGDLRLAQSDALSGQKPSSGCPTLDSYGFYVTSTSYSLYAYCTSGKQVDIKDVTLPSDISISISPSTLNPIKFKVLGQGTNIPASPTPATATITLTQANTGSTARITVTAGGQIQ